MLAVFPSVLGRGGGGGDVGDGVLSCSRGTVLTFFFVFSSHLIHYRIVLVEFSNSQRIVEFFEQMFTL